MLKLSKFQKPKNWYGKLVGTSSVRCDCTYGCVMYSVDYNSTDESVNMHPIKCADAVVEERTESWIIRNYPLDRITFFRTHKNVAIASSERL